MALPEQRPVELAGLDEVNARHRGALRRFFIAHPRVMDLLVVLAYLLLTFLSVPSHVHSWAWLLVLLICAILMFRRRFPLTVLLLVVVIEFILALPDVWVAGLALGSLFALYSVALEHNRLVAIGATLAAPAPMVALFFLTTPENSATFDVDVTEMTVSGFRIVVAITTYLAAIMAAGIGSSVQQRRRHDAAITAWAKKAAESGRAAERAVIAREMHDVVAHSLTVMVALADGAGIVLGKNPERAKEVLGEISRTGRDALADTRRVLGVLRDEDQAAPMGPIASQSDLERMIQGFFTAGLPLKYSFSGPPLPVDTSLRLAFFRIVQEGLTNVLRHARGVTTVDVRVEHLPGRVRIVVENDGVMASERAATAGGPTGGFGLAGMSTRAALYGGDVEAGPRPQGGWYVWAVLRYDEEQRRIWEKQDEQ